MSEHTEQRAVFEWALLMTGQHPELDLIYAIPNAGKRSYGAAAYYKYEGLKAGVPDICLAVANERYHGLYIEMKWPNKRGQFRITENQRIWIDKLRGQGYCAVVCTSADHAIGEIISYLGIEEE